MPCSSVVELIEIRLDESDRLKSYQLIKKTCGQGVGTNTLLEDFFASKSVQEILSLDDHELGESFPLDDETFRFLRLKHLYAVQATLETLTGAAGGGRNSLCAVAEVRYEEGELIVEAEIDVDIVTERIKACLACQGG